MDDSSTARNLSRKQWGRLVKKNYFEKAAFFKILRENRSVIEPSHLRNIDFVNGVLVSYRSWMR